MSTKAPQMISHGKTTKNTRGHISTSGFTLIELLVVVSIIGLLSSITLATLNSARAKSRDANRGISIGQINNAVLLYMADNAGKTPTLQGTCGGTAPGTSPSDCIATSYDNGNGRWSLLMADLAPYLPSIAATCTSSCSGQPTFGFTYVSPSAMYYYCQQIYCPEYTSGRLNFSSQYQVYANLENSRQIGTRTDGDYFYSPTGMYLNITATRNGVSVDSSYVGNCIVSLVSNPVSAGGGGTGPCIGVRQVSQPATFSSSWFNGCLQNNDGSIPTSCSRSVSPVTVSSPGITTMTIQVTQ